MNKSKLTLSIQPDLVEKAKEWAHKQGISLSEAVADFFKEKIASQPSGIAGQMRGIVAGKLSDQTDVGLKSSYYKSRLNK